MTDLPTTPAFPQATLRIAATYPATDGSVPESVEVEVNDPTAVTAEFVGAVILSLAAVPGARSRTQWHIDIPSAPSGGHSPVLSVPAAAGRP